MVHSTTPVAGFVTREQLEDVAASIPRTLHTWQGEEGPRWRITLSPGAVQLGAVDLGRRMASEERRRAALGAIWDTDPVTGAVTLVPTPEPVELELDDDGDVKGRRGRISAWSRKSVANMCRTLAQLDYSTLLEPGLTPAMLTLTLPGDWETVAGTPAAWRAIVNRFRSRYAREFGHDIAGVWKLEFQRRGAPHMHILTVIPAETAPRPLALSERAHLRGCKRAACDHSAHVRPDVPFRAWLAQAWALSVGHPDAAEYERHVRAGTRVDDDLEDVYGDPRRVAVYFSKHGAFENKGYQNIVPAPWRQAVEDEGKAGARFWGYWVIRPLRVTVEVDPSLIMHIARHLRRLERSRGYRRPASVQRVDTRTGVVRRRRVTRPVRYFRRTAGFLSVNDVPAIAGDIARIVDAWVLERDWYSFGGVPVPDHVASRAPRSGRAAHEHAHAQSGERAAA